MNMIRWILSHGFLVLFMVLLALAIYFRTELFPEHFPKETAVATTSPASAAPSAAVAAKDEPPVVAESPPAQPPSAEGAERAPAPVVIEPTPTAELPAAETEQASASSPALETASTAVAPAAEPEVAATETTAVSESAQSAVAEPTPAESAPAESAPTDAGRLLTEARQAFWRGEYDQAAEHYRALAAQEPEDPNPYGELGNLYFGQGKWQEAAAAYLEAGKRLLAAGRTAQAAHLQRIMVGLDSERAAELQKAIEASAKQ